MTKKYVRVLVEFKDNGDKIPKIIYFDDRQYEVDKVLSVINGVSLKVGGIGLKYKIRVCGKETVLFYEKDTDKWFVEAK